MTHGELRRGLTQPLETPSLRHLPLTTLPLSVFSHLPPAETHILQYKPERVCATHLLPVNFAGVFEDSDRFHPLRPSAAGDPSIVFDTTHLLASLMCPPPVSSPPRERRGGRLLKCKSESRGRRGQVQARKKRKSLEKCD